MTEGSRDILVWAGHGRDAQLAVQLLASHEFAAVSVASVAELVSRMPAAGCALITTEMLTPEARRVISKTLAEQPPWSDFPILLFGSHSPARAADAFEAASILGNVTVLERPVQSRTLVSAVVAALRARARQYEAREAIRRRDQFLAMLGHELRNPLAAIVLAVEAMHALCGNVATKQRNIIDRQARHLARLVDDLLDVARVTSGKVLLKREPTDLTRVIRRCIEGAELAARDHALDIRTSYTDQPMLVDGDLVRLEEVFGNLISNAIKYTGEHGSIAITTRREGGDCVVEIADTGVGIAPEMLERIFELFSQAEEGLDRSEGGLGIGLTLVRSLVELHGGSVVARSEGLGHGSRFTVRLPALPADARINGRHLAVVAAPPLELRVVLVDDNRDLLEMTKDVLVTFGCVVHTAADGIDGIEAILSHAPDIAFVDIGLPRVDGYEVAREVRRRAAHVPLLVAVSGYGQPEDRERARAAGFDQHLTKPLTVAAIRSVLDSMRRHKHATRGTA
jgi:signal transduction histidine kinase/CheY-like chemotaxis protein